jgi:hypothetical protein
MIQSGRGLPICAETNEVAEQLRLSGAPLSKRKGSTVKAIGVAIAVITAGLAGGGAAAGGPPRAAFDGRRSGPVASIGIGGGYTDISSKNGPLSGSTGTGTFAITFRLGYAPSEQLEIHAFYRASVYAGKLWEHWDDIADKAGSARGFTHAVILPIVPVIAMFTDQHLMMGLGATYYFEADTHAWFVEAGAGPSIAADPWELSGPSPFPGGNRTGLGFLAGVGYQFSKCGQASLELMWSRASWDDGGVEKSWTAMSTILTVAVAAF